MLRNPLFGFRNANLIKYFYSTFSMNFLLPPATGMKIKVFNIGVGLC